MTHRTNSRTVIVVILFLALTLSCKYNTPAKVLSEGEDFTFAFLTDIHVEKAKRGDKGLIMAIDNVNLHKPDFIITGGDLVADALGQTEERATELYSLYKELIEGFDCEVYNTQGNHEEFGIYTESGIDTDHSLYGDGMYEQMIGKRFYAFNQKGWRFYILDSVEDTPERKYSGHIDSTQLAWIRNDLESINPSTPIVISSHIPLLTSYSQIRSGAMAQNPLGLVVDNSLDLLNLFSGHNVKLVLQGHLHILEQAFINNITFITGGAVCGNWWNGPRNGMEEGYVLFKVKGKEIEWEYIDYGWR